MGGHLTQLVLLISILFLPFPSMASRQPPWGGRVCVCRADMLTQNPTLASFGDRKRKSARPADLPLRAWPGLGGSGLWPRQGCTEEYGNKAAGKRLSKRCSARGQFLPDPSARERRHDPAAEKGPHRFFPNVFLGGEKQKLHDLKIIVGAWGKENDSSLHLGFFCVPPRIVEGSEAPTQECL